MEKINRLASIGIVIPTFNEEGYVSKLLTELQKQGFDTIVVVDGGSTDQTVDIVNQLKVEIIPSKKKSRAIQMNTGGRFLHTDYLLFLHADVSIPSNFYNEINRHVQLGIELANFQLQFDSTHWFLKWNAPFSKTRWSAFQFGDQGLLIKKAIFSRENGFDQGLSFMEGNEIIQRIRKRYYFKKIPINLIVSDRKYQRYGVFRLQFSYYLIYLLIRLGLPQMKVQRLFKKVLN